MPRSANKSNPHNMSSWSGQNELITVFGQSPAILTETVWYLCCSEKGPKISLQDIHVLTTSKGRDILKEHFIDEARVPKSRWDKFKKEHQHNIPFKSSNINVITGPDGIELADIRSIDENEAAADYITEFVRNKTSNENAALYCSVAGGRKTMGVYLSYALQMYGREQDRLMHVLVQPGILESCRNFFYPPANSTKMAPYNTYNGEEIRIKASDIKIDVAFIPFVRLGHLVNMEPWRNRSYSDLVAEAQKELDISSLRLTLYLDGDQGGPPAVQKRICMKLSVRNTSFYILLGGGAVGKTNSITAQGAAHYAFCLLKKKHGPILDEISAEQAADMLWELYVKCLKSSNRKSREKLSDLSPSNRTNLNKIITDCLNTGLSALAPELILERDGNNGYTVNIPPECIEIRGGSLASFPMFE